ncbi:MAG: hypothetical protein GX224_05625 [Thermoplasmatales archaeon]|nr:hypothetical protein [Thermoplasmatales archaeon]
MTAYRLYPDEGMSGAGHGPGETISVQTLLGYGVVENVVTLYIDLGEGYYEIWYANNGTPTRFDYSKLISQYGGGSLYANMYRSVPPKEYIGSADMGLGWIKPGQEPSHMNTKADNTGQRVDFGGTLEGVSGYLSGDTLSLYVIWADAEPVPDTYYVKYVSNGDALWYDSFLGTDASYPLTSTFGTAISSYTAYLDPGMGGTGYDYYWGSIPVGTLKGSASGDIVTLYLGGIKYGVVFKDQDDSFIGAEDFPATDEAFFLPPAETLSLTAYTAYLDPGMAGEAYGPGDGVPAETMIGLSWSGSIFFYVDSEVRYSAYLNANNGTGDRKGPIGFRDGEVVAMPTKSHLGDEGWSKLGHEPGYLSTKDDGTGFRVEFGATVQASELIQRAEGRVVNLYVAWVEGEPGPTEYTVYLDPLLEGVPKEVFFTFTGDKDNVKIPSASFVTEKGWVAPGHIPDHTYFPDGVSRFDFEDNVETASLINLMGGGTELTLNLAWTSRTGPTQYTVMLDPGIEGKEAAVFFTFTGDETNVDIPPASFVTEKGWAKEGWSPAHIGKEGFAVKYFFGTQVEAASMTWLADGGVIALQLFWSYNYCEFKLVDIVTEERYYSCEILREGGTVKLPTAEAIGAQSYVAYSNREKQGTEFQPGTEYAVSQLPPPNRRDEITLLADAVRVFTVMVDPGISGIDPVEWGTFTVTGFGDERFSMPDVSYVKGKGWGEEGWVPESLKSSPGWDGINFGFGSSVPQHLLMECADGENVITLYIDWDTGEPPKAYELALVSIDDPTHTYWDCTFLEYSWVYLPSAKQFGMQTYAAYRNAEKTGESFGPVEHILGGTLKEWAGDSGNRIVLYLEERQVEVPQGCHGYIYANNDTEFFAGPLGLDDGEPVTFPTKADIMKKGWIKGGYVPSRLDTQADGGGTGFNLGTGYPQSEVAASADGEGIVRLYVIWALWTPPVSSVDYTLYFETLDGATRSCGLINYRLDDGVATLPQASEDQTHYALKFPYTVYFNREMDGASFEHGEGIPLSALVDLVGGRNEVTLFLKGEWEDQVDPGEEEYQYHAHFYANNGTGDSKTQGFNDGDPIPIPPKYLFYQTEWALEGHKPDHLNTKADGTGKRFEFGTTYQVSDLPIVDGVVEFHVRWVVGDYDFIVYFHVNNGSGAHEGPMGFDNDGGSVTLPPKSEVSDPSWGMEGFEPSHVNTKADGTGKRFDFGKTYRISDLAAQAKGGVLNIYIIWVPTGSDYYGFLHANDGTDRFYGPMLVEGTSIEMPSLPGPGEEFPWARERYVPIHLNTKADDSGTSFDFGTTHQASDLTAVAEGRVVRLYVIWDQVEFEIKWTVRGDVVKTEVLTKEDAIVPPDDPENQVSDDRENRFKGWRGYVEGAPPSADMTFAAIFELVLINVDVEPESINIAGADSDTAVLPQAIVQQIQTAAATDDKKTVTIELSGGKIKMDAPSVGSLASSEEQTVELRQMDKSEISQDVAEMIGDFPVYSINVGQTKEFAGKLTVSLRYTLKDGESAENVWIWYIKDDGTYERIPCVYDDGYATFETSHLSHYAVVVESPAPAEEGGLDMTLIAVAAVAAVAVVVAAVILVRRR